jgi:hypothetical protein
MDLAIADKSTKTCKYIVDRCAGCLNLADDAVTHSVDAVLHFAMNSPPIFSSLRDRIRRA